MGKLFAGYKDEQTEMDCEMTEGSNRYTPLKTWKWESDNGKDKIEYEVFNFDGPGIALSMYNLEDSIRNFARACMNFGLDR